MNAEDAYIDTLNAKDRKIRVQIWNAVEDGRFSVLVSKEELRPEMKTDLEKNGYKVNWDGKTYKISWEK